MSLGFDNKELRKLIGSRIKDLRIEKKLTQVQLGAKLGLSSSGAISQVENGSKGLKLASLIEAAKCLEVHPSVLIFPVNIKDPNDLIVLSKVIELMEKKHEQPEVAQSLLRAISGMLGIVPTPQSDVRNEKYKRKTRCNGSSLA